MGKKDIARQGRPDVWAGARNLKQIADSIKTLVSAILGSQDSTISPGPTAQEGRYDEDTMTWRNPNTGASHTQRCNARGISDTKR